MRPQRHIDFLHSNEVATLSDPVAVKTPLGPDGGFALTAATFDGAPVATVGGCGSGSCGCDSLKDPVES